MPFSTTSQNQNPGIANVANSLARIFVGDPKEDAKYRDQQIKNETEYLRQKQISEQTVTEAVRRKQIEAAAAAANAAAAASTGLANERNRKNKAATDLGSIFTADHTNYSAPGGMSMPGDAPAGSPGKGFDLNNPAIAGQVVGNVMRGEIDPKVLSAIALMPGQDDATLGRIMTGSGDKIGKDDYVSVNDRNKNRNYELGAGERLVSGQGDVIRGVDPSVSRGGGGKIPKLGQQDLNSMIRSAITSRGAKLDPKSPVAGYFAPQPQLYSDMSQLINEAWNSGGGNAAAVQALLSQYLDGADFSTFGSAVDNPGLFTGDTIQTIQPKVDVATLLQSLAAPQGVDPTIFTGGQTAPLPNRQNVGNGSGGWKIIGVE